MCHLLRFRLREAVAQDSRPAPRSAPGARCTDGDPLAPAARGADSARFGSGWQCYGALYSPGSFVRGWVAAGDAGTVEGGGSGFLITLMDAAGSASVRQK